ncbi:MAG: succinate dehydrogenase cytochrome b subunit [Cyanobacteria bacterium P01_H01_bin.15]
MNWIFSFLSSSIGKKIIMSLTGLFLIAFLGVHLAGNLRLLAGDAGQAYNQYAYLMKHNPLIQLIAWGLYGSILIHAVQGWLLWQHNRAARGSQGYVIKVVRTVQNRGTNSQQMGWLGTVIFVFLLVHLYQFWFKVQLGILLPVAYPGFQQGIEIPNVYLPVNAAFHNVGFVTFYVLAMVVIAMHLWHGFHSSWQTLGLNHVKYASLLEVVSKLYAIAIPLGFAVTPVYLLLFT